jgi:putative flippase GtrA
MRSMPDAFAAANPAVSRARTLRQFVIVGAVGFVIDASILTALTQFAGWTAWHARGPSFTTAVVVTWIFNRTHTFRGRGLQRRSLEALLYGAIQVCGALINLAVFGACLTLFPVLASIPVVPLAIGAGVALVCNFAASSLLLYRWRDPRSQPD